MPNSGHGQENEAEQAGEKDGVTHMAYIGCTRKLATEFKDRLIDEVQVLTGVQGWHANIYQFFRKKCVLALNDQTRYAIFFPGLSKSDILTFENLFVTRFEQELELLGASRGQTAQAKLMLGRMQFGKTHDRSVLGTMNDMAFCLDHFLDRLCRLPKDQLELAWISKSLNKVPCGIGRNSRYIVPVDEMKKILSSF